MISVFNKRENIINVIDKKQGKKLYNYINLLCKTYFYFNIFTKLDIKTKQFN